LTIDRIDGALLHALQLNGRATNAELSQQANLSESGCFRRVRMLEAAGIIERYSAIVDQRAVGLPLNVFLTITLVSQAEEVLSAFESAVALVPQIMECYLMTGQADYLVRAVARDVDDLEQIHRHWLTRLPGVARIQSSVTLRQVVKRAELPIRV
jgi:DNA-binding Lrp family transcriptional regulator